MTRQTWIALAAWLPALAAWGQMAEQPVVYLKAGLILHREVEVDLRRGKNGLPGGEEFSLTSGANPEVSDLTFTCSLRFDHEPGGGDHALDFAGVTGKTAGTFLLLKLGSEGEIALETSGDTTIRCSGSPRSPRANRGIPIAVSVRRDPRQSLSGLWIDGVEVESFNMPPQKIELQAKAVMVGGMSLENGIVSNIRLYNRALTRPEIIALAQEDAPKAPQEIIALIGGTEAVAVAESGWLETYLALKSAGAPNGPRTVLRNLSWEGDTVWRQDRPLNFGPLEQQLTSVQAKKVVLMFGRQECLERGDAGIASFRQALDTLVARCPRGALLMGCIPFNETPPPQRDLSTLNPILARYDEVIKAVAEARGGKFFDTAKSCRKQEQAWTRDGVTLNSHGEWLLGDITAFALGWLGQNPSAADVTHLRTIAQAKEQLWHRYWRPSNWAFLYGDRTTQPSSRDHLNPNVRWFPQELEQYRALITEKENELWKLSQELGRKLP